MYFVLFQSIPGCEKIKLFDDYFSVYRDHPGGIMKSDRFKDKNRGIKSFISISENFNSYNDNKYVAYTNYKIKEREVSKKISQASRWEEKAKIALRNIKIASIILVRKFTGFYFVNDLTLKFLS